PVNTPVMRKSLRLAAADYVDHFKARIATDPGAVFHTADFYAPGFKRLRATTWVRSEERCTDDRPLNAVGMNDPLRKVFDWSRPTSWFGQMREELVVDPIRFARKVVHWRNFEASHDLVELDPRIHEDPLLELQEYVVKAGQVATFLARLQEIVDRYKVPAVHLTLRHYGRCNDSYLSLGNQDAFAFLLAVRAKPLDALKADYAVWSRELVDAALEGEGSFNPAYQMHATPEQFNRAFAHRAQLLQAKKQFDPGNRFGNGLWSRYLDDQPGLDRSMQGEVSEFRAVFARTASRDAVYRLIAECGPRGHAPRMLGLLERMSERTAEDELIYRNMRSTLLKWRRSPFAAITARTGDWQRALHRRLAVFSRDQLQQADWFDGRHLDGMLEVGSGGRQAKALRRHIRIGGFVRQIDDFGYRPVSARPPWLEVRVPARSSMADAAQWDEAVTGIGDQGVGLVTLYGGLSGLPASQLPDCLGSLFKVLRPGGIVLLLEHDAESAHAGLDASLAVTLAYLCAGETWEASQAHPRAFRAADEWSALMRQQGLIETGERERIERTPFGDRLLAFRKPMVT
ncbi:MAG TPA: hypothetical protein VEY69_16415, partial [Lautropia sp.]|nr:hypothetical protein [Lautropia sp.]